MVIVVRGPVLSSQRPSFQPRVEALERRDLPSTSLGLFSSSIRNLVASAASHAIVVEPGGSIQAALDAARPGTTIRIEPGVYTETIRVARPNITLTGVTGPTGGVTLSNPGKAVDGISVTAAASGFVLENLTVAGFHDNGVLLEGVNGFRISHVTAVNDGQYGLFPAFCSDGLIESCMARGHSDTGIYIGQSTDVTIRSSTTSDNVNGIEVENSTNVRVISNHSVGNSAGILIDLLPGLRVKTDSTILVEGNDIHDNNRPNTANPKDIAAAVPKGVGILVLGAKQTVLERNTIEHNHFVGIGVASTLLLGQLAGVPAREWLCLKIPRFPSNLRQPAILPQDRFSSCLPVPGY